MKRIFLITINLVVLCIANLAHSFVTERSVYECRDGRRLSINTEYDGTFGMDFYYEANSEEYYEGSIQIVSNNEATVFHHEGDQVGTIGKAGSNKIILNIDGLKTVCSLSGSGLE